ncbi:hypothetical protein AMK59_5636 [Oryctes borbonicus]|uniref:RHD domain-containing protein n=1 Tax=Oryctes borbonicus TaxID=1629725 RepID=A0A0T6B1I9_9SCAR|nr:hypothetical protein AMK59_5636 [Oryctes borbonicus]
MDKHAKCIIVEQPAEKRIRFRYACEGRLTGSIPGVNSTPERKTYPTIKIEGYKGKVTVVVSCVTKEKPYRAHPHNLVGSDCKSGVCYVKVPEDTMTVSFQNLGIRCVTKKDMANALKIRKSINVDPFKRGFGHESELTSIDLNCVRLCFQAFIPGEKPDTYKTLLPVVSKPIYDKKAVCDLTIVELSDCVCPVDGGNKNIILLCEKVAKENIQIRFFEEKNNEVVWEGFGSFQPSQVHKQVAISFRPPKYKTLDVIEPVQMFIHLRRPSDNATSAFLPFQMIPLERKRRANDPIEGGGPNKKKLLELGEQMSNYAMADKTPLEVYSQFQPNIIDEPVTMEERDNLMQISINSSDLSVYSMSNLSLTDILPDEMTDNSDKEVNNNSNR